jgi:regulator of sigma E protease
LDRQASPTTQPASRPLVATVPVTIELTGTGGSERRTLDLPFDLEDAAPVRGTVWIAPAVSIQPFSPSSLQTTRQTNNPLQAAWWGVFETRDQIVNLYLTLKRVAVDRTVSPRNLSGPVGILHFGTIVAQRGYDWLLWFLAMLSANLAVVNFLPIPILDGGHMVFLIYEKIRGKPPSRAVQEGALWLGLLFLACFVVFVTFNDITRLIPL